MNVICGIDHAESSTSKSACDTLELITEHPYKRFKGLKELNFGKFDEESEDLNPKLSSGDEGEMERRQRVADTVLDIMRQEDHETVWSSVWSFGSSISSLRSHITVVDPKSTTENCCICKFSFENDVFTLIEIIHHGFSELKQAQFVQKSLFVQ